MLRPYDVSGYALLLVHFAVSALLAPPWLGPWKGLAFGVAYMLVLWFLAGTYISSILHMGIAHRALDFKDWFSQAVTLVHNTIGVYVNPIDWVRRHRKHHAHADHHGDPSKVPGDGLWKMLLVAVKPYDTDAPAPRDPILATWPYRLVSTTAWGVFSQIISFVLLWLIVRDGLYTFGLWMSARLIMLWGYLVINYWAHERRFGPRAYDDDNDSVNLPSWLAITGTFSGSWHNNHHHAPHLLRLSHRDSEYDFQLITVRFMKKLGLVKASPTGAHLPPDFPLREVGI